MTPNQRAGWSGIKNCRLLSPAGSMFDVFLAMDGGLEFQQNMSSLPVVVLIRQASEYATLRPRCVANGTKSRSACNSVIPFSMQ